MTTGPIAKLVLGGTIDGVQQWSIGFTCQAQTAPSSAELSTWLADVETKVNTWWTATGGGQGLNKAGLNLSTLTAYGYAELNTPATGQAELVKSSPLAGGMTTYAPSQCAIVCSLLTGYPGRHNRGRVYVPATTPIAGSNNRIPPTAQTNIATAMANFIKALATLTINGTTTSAVLVPSSGTSQSHFVTAVSVGDVVDTQRRRRDAYIESRVSVSSAS